MLIKKSWLVIVTALFLILLVACGSQSTGDDQSNDSNSESIEISLGHGFPESDFRARGFQYWADLVEERTDGKVTFQIHSSGSLVSVSQGYESVSTGVIDMYIIPSSFMSEQVPEIVFFDVPGVYDPNKTTELHEDIFPLVDEIFAEHNMKYLFGVYEAQQAVIVDTEKPLVTPNDFVGKKIRASGTKLTKVIEAFGGSAVAIDLGELPQAVSSGVVDGAYNGWPNILSLKLYETLPSVTVFPTSSVVWEFGSINLDTWNKLSKEQQDIMIEAGKEAMIKIEEFGIESYENLKEEVEKANAHLYELTETEEDAFRELAEPVIQSLYDESNDKGKELFEIIKKYQ